MSLRKQNYISDGFNMKRIGHTNFALLQTYISRLTLTELRRVMVYPSFLYFFFFFVKQLPKPEIIQFFFQFQTRQTLLTCIQKLRGKSEDYLASLSKSELQTLFVEQARMGCHIDNIFLQDIFDPALIFKSKYEPYNFNIFLTSFYYIMNCRYSKSLSIGLSIQKNESFYFRFPMDISPKEWCRPIILIDVSNVLQSRGPHFFINNKMYNAKNFFDRKKAIVENHKYILTRLFQKHPEPNTMVLFVTQHNANTLPKKTCLSITKLWKETSSDRKAFLIEVPCNDFVYQLKGKQRLNDGKFDVYYDNYGNLFRYDPFRYKYDKVSKKEDIDALMDTFGNRYIFSQPYGGYVPQSMYVPPHQKGARLIKHKQTHLDPKQNNPFRQHVKQNSQCVNSLNKNELDDYLIGLILLLIKLTNEKCSKLILRYKPIVFSNDNYRWMRPQLKDSFIHAKENTFGDSRDNFIDYIEDVAGKPIRRKSAHSKEALCQIDEQNYKFWLSCLNRTTATDPITNELKTLIEETNDKLYPL